VSSRPRRVARRAGKLQLCCARCQSYCATFRTHIANSVIPIAQGLDYQARIFWLQVLRLLRDGSPVRAVGYGADNLKGFDDVVVYYGEQGASSEAPEVVADHYQINFHVAHDDVFTAKALTEPAFIHAESRSLLQRLQAAQLQRAPDGRTRRFYLVPPLTGAPG